MRATQPQHSRKLNGNNARNAYIESVLLRPREERDHAGISHSAARHCRCWLGIALRVPASGREAYDPWPGLVQDIFNNRPMNDGTDVIAIEMPYRAEDAAIVPVTLRTMLSPDDRRASVRSRW